MTKARTASQKLKAKRGRPRKDGIREPSGRLSRSGIEHEPANRPAIEARMRQLDITEDQAMDQKASTFVGYLNLIGPRDGLSDAQYEGAVAYLYFRERLSRALKSPAALYDPEAAGAGGDITEAYEDWCKATVAEWNVLKQAIQAEQNTSRDNLWAALQLVVIEDQRMHHMVGATRVLCNVLARHFKTVQADKRAA